MNTAFDNLLDNEVETEFNKRFPEEKESLDDITFTFKELKSLIQELQDEEIKVNLKGRDLTLYSKGCESALFDIKRLIQNEAELFKK